MSKGNITILPAHPDQDDSVVAWWIEILPSKAIVQPLVFEPSPPYEHTVTKSCRETAPPSKKTIRNDSIGMFWDGPFELKDTTLPLVVQNRVAEILYGWRLQRRGRKIARKHWLCNYASRQAWEGWNYHEARCSECIHADSNHSSATIRRCPFFSPACSFS